MKQISWKVEGMDCASCAVAINKSLQKAGMKNIKVNHVNGNVSFETNEPNKLDAAAANVESLGYKVNQPGKSDIKKNQKAAIKIDPQFLRFIICLPFTLMLMSHMWLPFHWLHHPYIQLGLTIPVYLIGTSYFGVSAWKNLRKGNFHMNVLIALGSSAAFAYSCIGLYLNRADDFLFFETTASIITIVFFGNWLEHISVERTQRQIKQLTKQYKVMAHMIAYDDQHNEIIFPVENKDLKVGDLILIKTGEEVPMDCKILSGEVEVNEAIITGESLPVHKKQGDILIGGSIIINGNAKSYVSAVGENTVLSSIVHLIEEAQTHKPPLQLLADKISNVFIPAVLLIATATFLLNLFIGNHSFGVSLIRSIAVLVIACPCAMGLATPAALAVGMGRAARHGILYTQPGTMELFKNIQQIVFDKTGTLTTGKFNISNYRAIGIDENEFKTIVYSLEKISNHPIAKSITLIWQQPSSIKWKKIEEIKGIGVKGIDKEDNVFCIGSHKINNNKEVNEQHHLYITKNDNLIGWIDIDDEIRPEAKAIIDFYKSKGVKTILLSGDNFEKCKKVADILGIDTVIAEQTPKQKLDKIEALSNTAPTIMVGDGINDAPALAKATISISLSEASKLAIQSASVVLTNNGLQKLPMATLLGKATYSTVKSNLFWAFIYNIVAIPVAAIGLLSPGLAAFIMGISDVVLIFNSLWLGVKRLNH